MTERFSPSHYRKLGGTEIQVSPLALGTVKLGRNQMVKFPEPFDLPDDRQVQALLGVALDLGINLIDTAPAYGTSEKRLGRWLPRPLDQWIIASKAGESFSHGASTFDFSAEAIRLSVESSLQNLQRDYLDLLMLHSDGSDSAILADERVLLILDQLKQQGKVRACGISSKTLKGAMLGVDLMDFIMVTPAEQDAINHAAAAGKGVLIKKPLESGHLSSPSTRLVELAGDQRITSTVTGTISRSHLQENVASMLTGLAP